MSARGKSPGARARLAVVARDDFRGIRRVLDASFEGKLTTIEIRAGGSNPGTARIGRGRARRGTWRRFWRGDLAGTPSRRRRRRRGRAREDAINALAADALSRRRANDDRRGGKRNGGDGDANDRAAAPAAQRATSSPRSSPGVRGVLRRRRRGGRGGGDVLRRSRGDETLFDSVSTAVVDGVSTTVVFARFDGSRRAASQRRPRVGGVRGMTVRATATSDPSTSTDPEFSRASPRWISNRRQNRTRRLRWGAPRSFLSGSGSALPAAIVGKRRSFHLLERLRRRGPVRMYLGVWIARPRRFPPLHEFSLGSSVRDMARGDVPSILIAVFSGGWPYLKLAVMLFAWFAPPPAPVHPRVEGVCSRSSTRSASGRSWTRSS